MRALVCSIVLTACNYTPRVGGSDGAVPDGPLAGQACGWTFSPRHVGDPCTQTSIPAMTLTPGTWTYNTDSGQLRDPAGIPSTPGSTAIDGDPAIRVLTTDALTIEPAAELIVQGSRGFGLVVNESATIDGAIDVSATFIGNAITPGPGGSLLSCLAREGGAGGSAVGTDFGGGGGGGGGFGSAGADGAVGGESKAPGGTGGVASADDFVLRGGCGGGDGGVSNNVKGVPGAGGGILLLVVKGATAVRNGAQLRSGGSGALNGGRNSGGPGGGSGGLIAIQTANLALSGLLCANGGGAAGGSGDNSDGGVGQSALCSATDAADGGNGAGNGGDGGVGTIAPQPGTVNLGDNDGGGGGGGSVGRVYVRAASLNDTGTHSPVPVVLPFDGF